MQQEPQPSETELRRVFLANGSNFFGWNSGKNTPNILLKLVGSLESLESRTNDSVNAIGSLDKTIDAKLGERLNALESRTKESVEAINVLNQTIRDSSDSSSKLAAALNRLTLALVIIGAIGLLAQTIYVAFTIWNSAHH